MNELISVLIKDLVNEFGISENMAFEALKKKNWNFKKATQYIQEDAMFEAYENKVIVTDPVYY